MNRLVCTSCHGTYPLDGPRWRCDCGALLDVSFEPAFDLPAIANRAPTMWRYREAIPLREDAHILSFDEGFTPLLAIDFAGTPVWIKQDHLFPTGSYKDRGASVTISVARGLGMERVVEDSSGNAGCAIAAYCARGSIACAIYVPADTAQAKVAQIQRYGATLVRVPGTRQDTADAAWQAAQTIYYASHSWNPFFFQGTKTFAYEVCEQLGWRAPDVVILPAGNGTLVLGAYLGFRDLLHAGIVERMPRLIAVQAAGCAPLYDAFRRGLAEPTRVEAGSTLAEGIAIAAPVRGRQILAAVRESGGAFLRVSEDEIVRALHWICEKGYYVEPTAAATVAGVEQYVRERGPAPDEVIVSAFTGHGLKATEKMLSLAL